MLAFVAALRARDFGALGPLLTPPPLAERGLRNVPPDVDVLVALAQAEPDVLGARMTGGGCGGAVLFLTTAGRAYGIGIRLVDVYRATTGRLGSLLVPAAGS